MRCMILLKANQATEAGTLPSKELLAAMTRYNEELANAGVLVAGEGLQPSARGARVHLAGSRRTVETGPFADHAGLIAGFWIFEVPSLEAAIEWVKRCPFPFEGDGAAEIEIRPLYEMDDFGAEFTPELRAAEARLRAQIAGQGKSTPRH